MRGTRRPGSGMAAAVAILLLGVAAAGTWLVVAPSVLGAASPALVGPLAEGQVAPGEAQPAALLPGVRAIASAQVSQPRDPFRPLITEGAVVDTGTGAIDGGVGGGVGGIRVRLVSIQDVFGVLRATVEVDGIAYDVGVGDTFATDFRVVSLDTDSGVFLFRDNAFELSVGQEILK